MLGSEMTPGQASQRGDWWGWDAVGDLFRSYNHFGRYETDMHFFLLDPLFFFLFFNGMQKRRSCGVVHARVGLNISYESKRIHV